MASLANEGAISGPVRENTYKTDCWIFEADSAGISWVKSHPSWKSIWVEFHPSAQFFETHSARGNRLCDTSGVR